MSVTFSTSTSNQVLTQTIVSAGIGSATQVVIDGYIGIGNNAFQGYTNLILVTIPSSVTSIGQSAFQGCTNLSVIAIPSSVTSIGNNAFQYCTSLSAVAIPSSVTSITQSAFYGCTDLTSVIIINSVNSSGVSIGVTSIGKNAFQGCTSLPVIAIPSSVINIEQSAFYGCTDLTSVTIGNSVNSSGVSIGVINIGNNAFQGCTSLPVVAIPSSVINIGQSAFNGCTGLTSVTIGNSVSSIANYAFQGCTGLTSVTIPSSVTSIGQYAFQMSGLTIVYIADDQLGIQSPGSDVNFFGATVTTQLPPSTGEPGDASSTGDNLLESTSAGVGTLFGVLTAASLGELFNKRNNHNVLRLSAGVGSVIGTTLHGVLRGQPYYKTLENGIVGFPAAMTGYVGGQYINDRYANNEPIHWSKDSNGNTTFLGALSNGTFAGLFTGATVGVKNMVREVGCNTNTCY
jgi:hypothetical protein